MDLQRKADELRLNCLKAVYHSGGGHIGGDMSVMEILVTLYYQVMNITPENFQSKNHDYFLLSKGHCVDALYAVLADKGFFKKEEYIDTFSKFGSKFIGHPNTEVYGIESNSGSLGHGISLGVGICLANRYDHLENRVFVVCGDGEMAEGSNYEAMMSAGHYQLNRLCVIVDKNNLQISGTTKEVMDSSSLAEKFKAFKFNVIEVKDGNNIEELSQAFASFEKEKEKPTAIIANTTKGKGVSFMENQASWHHGVLNEEQYCQAAKEIERRLGK